VTRGTIAERYAAFRTELARVAREAGRDPQTIGVLAVTKQQQVPDIAQAIAAGVTEIGENYVQEALRKFPDLPAVRKHFIGHVQTNKAPAIARLFDVVESIDRPAAGHALARAAERLGKRLPILIQLNVSPYERFGCPPERAVELAEELRSLPSITVDGVMAIAPIRSSESALASAFETAARTFARIGGSTFSIGMSDDWPFAVRAGATLLRIGSALFGPRPAPPASKPEAKTEWAAERVRRT